MQSGVPLVMAGLHMTHQALVLPEEVERIRALANPVACAVAEMLDFYLPIYLNGPNRLPGAAMHDPCTIAWLLAPQLFSSERYWVGGGDAWALYDRDDAGRSRSADGA
ncbi:Pyrimidine-specific ribonucleoside hydrolase rihA [Edwardsiella tarda]|nr:Pyrimidine-specific ribonucleoside hydrolase rihA [Edwardsiella tarda]